MRLQFWNSSAFSVCCSACFFLQPYLTIYLNSAAAFTPSPLPASSQLFLFLAYDALNVFSFSPLLFFPLLSSSACSLTLVQWTEFFFQSRVMILNILIPVVSLCIAIKPSVLLWSVCVPAARIERAEGLSISHFSWFRSADVAIVH